MTEALRTYYREYRKLRKAGGEFVTGMTTCKKCGLERPKGFDQRCKPCTQKRIRDWNATKSPEYHRAVRLKKVAQNPERFRLAVNRRRARKANAPGLLTKEQWLEIQAQQAHKCAICGEAKPLEIDHIIPLTAPGTSNDAWNIQGLCRQCNVRKGGHRGLA